MVEVGTKVRYASVHQFGGDVESKPITKEVQRSLWRWLKGEKLERRRRLGWLLNPKFTGKTLKGSVPARPFVGITKDTRRAVRKIIGVEIMEVR